MEIVKFPSWRWHPLHGKRLIHSAVEEADLGAGWVDTPAKLSTSPGEPVAAVADAGPSDQTDAAVSEQQELWKAPVAAIVAKLANASVETLQKVKGYEALRPAGPRATLLKAIDAALAKAVGAGAEAAVMDLAQTVQGQ